VSAVRWWYGILDELQEAEEQRARVNKRMAALLDLIKKNPLIRWTNGL